MQVTYALAHLIQQAEFGLAIHGDVSTVSIDLVIHVPIYCRKCGIDKHL